MDKMKKYNDDDMDDDVTDDGVGNKAENDEDGEHFVEKTMHLYTMTPVNRSGAVRQETPGKNNKSTGQRYSASLCKEAKTSSRSLRKQEIP